MFRILPLYPYFAPMANYATGRPVVQASGCYPAVDIMGLTIGEVSQEFLDIWKSELRGRDVVARRLLESPMKTAGGQCVLTYPALRNRIR